MGGHKGMVMSPLVTRLWSKVRTDEATGCWEWMGCKNPKGYGRIQPGGRGHAPRPAHRVAYELSGKTIPPGLQLDHLCRNPSCVNPAHLEAVTHRENQLRGNSAWARVMRTGQCLRGHPRIKENLYVRKDRAGVNCIPCRKELGKLRASKRSA
jgi:hypothetical protein